MILTEEEAKKKLCPFKFNNSMDFWNCDPLNCMAWEPDRVWEEGSKGKCKLIERGGK